MEQPPWKNKAYRSEICSIKGYPIKDYIASTTLRTEPAVDSAEPPNIEAQRSQAGRSLHQADQKLNATERNAYEDTWLPKPRVLRGIAMMLEHPDVIVVHAKYQNECAECSITGGIVIRPPPGRGRTELEAEEEDDHDGDHSGPFLGLARRKAAVAASGRYDKHVPEWDRVPVPPKRRHIPDLPCITYKGDIHTKCARCVARGKTCKHRIGGSFSQLFDEYGSGSVLGLALQVVGGSTQARDREDSEFEMEDERPRWRRRAERN
ncbi:hypothetical protein I317_07712 [Kwoniella heveanensis CBS 569]|nr:hypothetical protein I317_07712 [Kwoniella heveanensis CBS 569]